MKYLKYITTILMLLVGGKTFAQDAQATSAAASIPSELFWLLVASAIVIAFACLVLAVTVWALIIKQTEPKAAEAGVEISSTEIAPSLRFGSIWRKINDFVPMAKEHTIDMGHDYDGIRELDNNLPPWWKYGFYFTIFFAVAYMGYYHFSSDWSSENEYLAAMEEAEAEKAAYLAQAGDQIDENTVKLLTDDLSLESGKKIYDLNCLACHGPDGGGGIGPNLTDQYWLHGGSVSDVFSTIKYGVPEKGMISWAAMLQPDQIQEVSSYIYTFQGTTPVNAKEPQGELYEPDAAVEESTSDSTSVAMN